MTSLPSNSEGGGPFSLLHPSVQRWIWEQNWNELRDIQARTILAVLRSKDDIVISATTAAGKTEAAFLPILTSIADVAKDQLAVLYVSPLKALINDQFRRLESLCEALELGVVRWHGDAPQSAKSRTLKRPSGIALITPESIEALLVRRPGSARRLFENLSFVVVDELHAFLQGPRGLHLFSLLRRVDRLAKFRPRRIGLSATLGDITIAKRWLNALDPDRVREVISESDRPGIKLTIKTVVDPPRSKDDGVQSKMPDISLDKIVEDLFARLRLTNNLVFAGSRKNVEAIADALRLRCEEARVPLEFFPHHGNLSKDLREGLEARLKRGDLPTTAIATTTLELGIDIGSVESVALIGPPRSISSLKQKVGRSGRREGALAVLRVFVRCKHVDAGSDVLDRLNVPVVQAVAAIELLKLNRLEPPASDPNVVTVVLHQILSVICERGAMRADQLYKHICSLEPLHLEKEEFVALLRCMAAPQTALLEQATDGTIMLGSTGELVTGSRDFFAIFPSDEEWRLVTKGTALGTIPLINSVGKGSVIGFAGRRWRVVSVDDGSKVLDLMPHPSTKIPLFSGDGEPIHDILAAAIRDVYRDMGVPSWVDVTSAKLLGDGRRAYAENELDDSHVLRSGGSIHLFTWRGTTFNSVVAACLRSAGLSVDIYDVGVSILGCEIREFGSAVESICSKNMSPMDIAKHIQNLDAGKYDRFIERSLLRALWARRNAGVVTEAIEFLQRIWRQAH